MPIEWLFQSSHAIFYFLLNLSTFTCDFQFPLSLHKGHLLFCCILSNLSLFWTIIRDSVFLCKHLFHKPTYITSSNYILSCGFPMKLFFFLFLAFYFGISRFNICCPFVSPVVVFCCHNYSHYSTSILLIISSLLLDYSLYFTIIKNKSALF